MVDDSHPTAPVAAPAPLRLGAPAWAWTLYDFGYSMFAFVVFARYLSDWLIIDRGRPDYYYTNTQAVVALTLVVAMPVAGMLADRYGRHVPLLAAFTLLACAAASGIGLVDVGDGLLGTLPVLALGWICASATALAFAQFDPLLARVAPRRSWGMMSGVAVAAGYMGVIGAIAVFGGIVVGAGDKQQAFIPAALIFLACAAPAFLVIRERGADPAEQRRRPNVFVDAGRSILGLRASLRRLAGHRGVLRLLAGRFFYTDAIGTVNIYLAVYISRIGGFSEAQKDLAILVGVASAGAGALMAGWIVRRAGPRRTLLSILPCFAAGLAITAGFGAPWTIWVLAPVIGIALGTAYTVDRVFMLAITPPEVRGELFGFFNLVGRVAQAMGPFVLWGGVIYVLHDATGWTSTLTASRISMGLLAASTLVGLAIIRSLDDRHDEA